MAVFQGCDVADTNEPEEEEEIFIDRESLLIPIHIGSKWVYKNQEEEEWEQTILNYTQSDSSLLVGVSIYVVSSDTYDGSQFVISEKGIHVGEVLLFRTGMEDGEQYTISVGESEFTYEHRVEEVTVPAGTFQASVYENLDTNERIYFAPGVGEVKWVDQNGNTDELVSYQLEG